MSDSSATELQAIRAELLAEEAANLDDCLEAAEEYADKYFSKMVLVGSGSTLRVVLGTNHGAGECDKQGTSEFTRKPVPTDFRGDVLKVGRITVVLSDNGREVWRGRGSQKGLTGTWNVRF